VDWKAAISKNIDNRAQSRIWLPTIFSLSKLVSNLASALLHHIDPTVAEEHYNRASSLGVTQAYADLIRAVRDQD
jgi:hypothetical protein